MQIVIDIPDRQYELLQRVVKTKRGMENLSEYGELILNGTPLPKGHGRLIDADEYKEHLYACETNGIPLHIMDLDERLATVDEVPTIIEADKAESEDKKK